MNFFSFIRTIRKKRFDLVIDLRCGEYMDSLLLSLCGAKYRVGYDSMGFGFFINCKVPYPDLKMHEVERNLSLLEHIGLRKGEKDMRPEAWIPQDARAHMQSMLSQWRQKSKVLIAVHPGAGRAEKVIPPEILAQAIDGIVSKMKTEVVLIGSNTDKENADMLRKFLIYNVIDMVGKITLQETAAIIEGCSLFIGSDTGPTHIAIAVGTPTVFVFYGKGNPERFGPYGNGKRELIRDASSLEGHILAEKTTSAAIRLLEG